MGFFINLHMLSKVSSERKWAELSRIMQGTGRTEVIELMVNSNILIQVIPENRSNPEAPPKMVSGIT